ncbi:MAG: GMP synthase [Chitinophagaceae bacterium]
MYKTQQQQIIRVAILDLYEGHANQGMRCLRELLQEFAQKNQFKLVCDEFDVRLKKQVPDLSYDLYISSGGPGSPLDSEGSEWENLYFNWIRQTVDYNLDTNNADKKPVFFICHSFQLACRYFDVAKVARRRSTAFGVFPVHMLPDGVSEPIFAGLQDPFYVLDSRDYQVVQPNYERLQELGASLLAIEKERPHVPLERAIMGIRFNEYMIGTQFHPEADAIGTSMYLQRDDRKQIVVDNHGFEKWQSMIEQLNDPDKILYTYAHVIPNFLNIATEQLVGEES